MAVWLRALTTLLRTHVHFLASMFGISQSVVTPAIESDALFWPLQVPALTHTQAHTDIHRIAKK